MNNLIRHATIPVLLGAGIAVATSACAPAADQSVSVGKHHMSAAQEAQAQGNAKALTRCLPHSALAQIELARTLGTHSGRAALVTRCGVPPSKRSAVEAEALSAAEHGNLTTKAGRVTYFEVTLPQIIERNQA